MSRLLVVGLIITVVVLGINYLTAISRNAETSRELSRLKREFHEGSAGRSETLKKLEMCRADLIAAGNVSKKLDVEAKRKSEKIADMHKLENKMKEEITSLNAQLSAAKNDTKV